MILRGRRAVYCMYYLANRSTVGSDQCRSSLSPGSATMRHEEGQLESGRGATPLQIISLDLEGGHVPVGDNPGSIGVMTESIFPPQSKPTGNNLSIDMPSHQSIVGQMDDLYIEPREPRYSLRGYNSFAPAFILLFGLFIVIAFAIVFFTPTAVRPQNSQEPVSDLETQPLLPEQDSSR